MDSKALFIEQVGGHMNSLCELLACATGEPAGADAMTRGMTGTRMLAGTAALMDLNAWEELLNEYHGLLDAYRAGNHPWDERVAGVTGEIVEREERLVAEYEADPRCDVPGVICPTELSALITEVEALREECGPAEPGGAGDGVDGNASGAVPADAPIASSSPAASDNPAAQPDADEFDAEAEAALCALDGAIQDHDAPGAIDGAMQDSEGHTGPAANGTDAEDHGAHDADAGAGLDDHGAHDADAGVGLDDHGAHDADAGVGLEDLGAHDADAGVGLEDLGAHDADAGVDLAALGARSADDVPLSRVLEQLRTVAGELLENIDTGAWRNREWESHDVRSIRAHLGTLAFCAGSIERAVRTYAGDGAPPPWCSLDTLACALDDFVNELARGTGRELKISVTNDGTSVDAALLAPAEAIVQWMIADIFERSEARRIEVSVSVSERHGAMCWRISDDGENRVSDSRLDREDQPAFYPRLRNVIRTLASHHGALWVEPRESRSRFEFTLPVTHEPEPLLQWGGNGDTFAVRASQLCEVVPAASRAHEADSYGDYLDLDGSRVPLVSLGDLFGGAPSEGEMIAVVGTVEKRVAFYVPDCGERATGRPDNESVSIWRGPAQHVIRIGDRRVPLLDADDVLAAYLTATGSISSENTPGKVARDELDGVQSQASASASGAAALPGTHAAPADGALEVVVVEQSDGLRDEFGKILANGNVRAGFATDVDEAMALVRAHSPRLIISEFRMPSMAAKHIVDRLHDGGPDVPVLVTTSQSGKTADLLVEKLGVSGYLSKPLKGADVVQTIGAFLDQDVPAS